MIICPAEFVKRARWHRDDAIFRPKYGGLVADRDYGMPLDNLENLWVIELSE